MFVTRLALTFSALQKKKGLCISHSKTPTVLSFGHGFDCTPRVILPLEDPFVPKLQPLHIMFFLHDTICFEKCTSLSSSKTHKPHDATTPVLYRCDGDLRPASFPCFLPDVVMVIMA
ncbi:hypothetical protein AMECASPLE_026008 [Ameca splendens]|uniref:Uncharacterized protein n=1 Tax=Ameca splendens TaxID=208324 RepID=A0ABV0ZFI4_9TELE